MIAAHRFGRVIFQWTVVSILIFGRMVLPAVNRALAKPDPEKIDYALIDAYVQSQLDQIPNTGLAYGIVHEDKIVHLQAFGAADPSGREVTPQTPFVVASVGKTLTALAIRQLVNSGEVDLDTPVQRYILWFHLADPQTSARITVRHLLEHTSGIPNAAGNQAYQLDPNYTTEQLVHMASTVQLNRPVGESFEYSNLNYLALGVLIETIAGQSYPSYIQTHILSPLKMQHSYLSEAEAIKANPATGYQSWFGFMLPVQYPFPRGMLPAGDSVSTAEDLTHLLIAYLNNGNFEGISVTDPDGRNPPGMHAGTDSYYDIHWILRPCPCLDINEGQSGGAANYNADLQILPGKKWGVVVLMNSRFMFDSVVPSVTAATIALNVSYLLQGYRPTPTPSLSFTQVYLIIDLVLSGLLTFTALRVVVLMKSIKSSRHLGVGRPRILLILLDLVLGLGILFGFPFMIGILNGLPFQTGYKWDLLYIAFPDITVVLLSSSILLLIVVVGNVWITVHQQ